MLKNERQHNGPQSQVRLKVIYEVLLKALFVNLRQSGCRQFHNLAPNAKKDLSFTRNLDP